jgi:hypothetical protein
MCEQLTHSPNCLISGQLSLSADYTASKHMTLYADYSMSFG